MTGKQLKNSILQWAIQGKLVPQDPNDEPASVLLEKIRQEKERLIKEKKIKRDKNASFIFRGEDNSYYEKFAATGEVKCIDEEIPFEIPQGWEWCRMGSIGEWGAGATPAKGNLDYYNGNILWLRTGELNNDVVYDTEIKITEKALRECSLRLNKIGDVMIAMYGATIGKVAIAGKEMTTNQACCACTPIGVFNWFLFYFLMGSQLDFIKKGEGGAQPNISREKLIKHLMPVPPIEEQQRIVLKIREVLPYVDKYAHSQDAHNHLNQSIRPLLRKSILHEAIQGKLVPQIAEEGTARELLGQIRHEKQKLVEEGKLKKTALTDSIIYKGEDNRYYEKIDQQCKDITEEIPFEIPENWEWCRMQNVINFINGRAYKKEELLDRGKYKVLRVGNFFTNIEWYYSDLELPEDKYCYNGDLLYAWSASFGPQIWEGDKTIFHYHIWNVKYDPRLLYREYLYYFFLYDKTQIKKATTGSTMIHVSMENMKLRLLPIPPLQEQQRIVAQIERLFEQLK